MDYSKISPLQNYALIYVEEQNRPGKKSNQFGLIVPEQVTPIRAGKVIKIGDDVKIFGEIETAEIDISVYFNIDSATELGDFYYLVPEKAIVAKINS